MQRFKLALIGCFLLIGLMANGAMADSVTYNFDMVLTGGGAVQSKSFGTFTFTDNGNAVLLNVQLNDPSWKLLELGLNFDETKFSNSSNLKLVNETLSISVNGVKADGYSGLFDIQIPSSGNLGAAGKYSNTITWNGGASNLDISDFNFTDTGNLLYTSLHIGNYENGSSIWVGGSPRPVAEPATLILLGCGLVGIAGFRKRQQAQERARAAGPVSDAA
ncbi:MAG: PEP-CTERM sorting domain-containing protein [Syntrophobacteraceae bacterium]